MNLLYKFKNGGKTTPKYRDGNKTKEVEEIEKEKEKNEIKAQPTSKYQTNLANTDQNTIIGKDGRTAQDNANMGKANDSNFQNYQANMSLMQQELQKERPGTARYRDLKKAIKSLEKIQTAGYGVANVMKSNTPGDFAGVHAIVDKYYGSHGDKPSTVATITGGINSAQSQGNKAKMGTGFGNLFRKKENRLLTQRNLRNLEALAQQDPSGKKTTGSYYGEGTPSTSIFARATSMGQGFPVSQQGQSELKSEEIKKEDIKPEPQTETITTTNTTQTFTKDTKATHYGKAGDPYEYIIQGDKLFYRLRGKNDDWIEQTNPNAAKAGIANLLGTNSTFSKSNANAKTNQIGVVSTPKVDNNSSNIPKDLVESKSTGMYWSETTQSYWVKKGNTYVPYDTKVSNSFSQSGNKKYNIIGSVNLNGAIYEKHSDGKWYLNQFDKTWNPNTTLQDKQTGIPMGNQETNPKQIQILESKLSGSTTTINNLKPKYTFGNNYQRKISSQDNTRVNDFPQYDSGYTKTTKTFYGDENAYDEYLKTQAKKQGGSIGKYQRGRALELAKQSQQITKPSQPKQEDQSYSDKAKAIINAGKETWKQATGLDKAKVGLDVASGVLGVLPTGIGNIASAVTGLASTGIGVAQDLANGDNNVDWTKHGTNVALDIAGAIPVLGLTAKGTKLIKNANRAYNAAKAISESGQQISKWNKTAKQILPAVKDAKDIVKGGIYKGLDKAGYAGSAANVGQGLYGSFTQEPTTENLSENISNIVVGSMPFIFKGKQFLNKKIQPNSRASKILRTENPSEFITNYGQGVSTPTIKTPQILKDAKTYMFDPKAGNKSWKEIRGVQSKPEFDSKSKTFSSKAQKEADMAQAEAELLYKQRYDKAKKELEDKQGINIDQSNFTDLGDKTFYEDRLKPTNFVKEAIKKGKAQNKIDKQKQIIEFKKIKPSENIFDQKIETPTPLLLPEKTRRILGKNTFGEPIYSSFRQGGTLKKKYQQAGKLEIDLLTGLPKTTTKSGMSALQLSSLQSNLNTIPQNNALQAQGSIQTSGQPNTLTQGRSINSEAINANSSSQTQTGSESQSSSQSSSTTTKTVTITNKVTGEKVQAIETPQGLQSTTGVPLAQWVQDPSIAVIEKPLAQYVETPEEKAAREAGLNSDLNRDGVPDEDQGNRKGINYNDINLGIGTAADLLTYQMGKYKLQKPEFRYDIIRPASDRLETARNQTMQGLNAAMNRSQKSNQNADPMLNIANAQAMQANVGEQMGKFAVDQTNAYNADVDRQIGELNNQNRRLEGYNNKNIEMDNIAAANNAQKRQELTRDITGKVGDWAKSRQMEQSAKELQYAQGVENESNIERDRLIQTKEQEYNNLYDQANRDLKALDATLPTDENSRLAILNDPNSNYNKQREAINNKFKIDSEAKNKEFEEKIAQNRGNTLGLLKYTNEGLNTTRNFNIRKALGIKMNPGYKGYDFRLPSGKKGMKVKRLY